MRGDWWLLCCDHRNVFNLLFLYKETADTILFQCVRKFLDTATTYALKNSVKLGSKKQENDIENRNILISMPL